jgi:Domain of unknown function (DUF4959)/Domain of unknown function/Domain of unknown function (DUF5126)
MKTINKIFLMLSLGLMAIFTGCKEDKLGPLEKNTNPPGQVSNITVVNGPGSAKLTYVLPADKDLLYVRAVYTLANGKEVDVKASYYDSSLLLEGFGDTNEHEIKVYAVNRSEVASAPTIVKVKPLENSIWDVFRDLKVVPDFAGIKFTSTNPTKTDLAIEIFIKKDGKYVTSGKNIYTKAADIDQSIRGLDTIPKQVAVTIRDRWLNYTDTLYTTVKPLYEVPLSKSYYKTVTLPTDSKPAFTDTYVSKMWDGNRMDWPSVNLTDVSVLTPQWVTFDVGQQTIFSRIVVWGYPDYTNAGRLYYNGGCPKDFEVWGSDNPPADGSFNNWVLLGSYTSTKPSGSPYGVQTAEDYAFANAGINYTFNVTSKKLRYLRIKSIKNWQGTSFMAISEVQVYGDPR